MQIGINIYSGIDFKKQVQLFKKYGIQRTFVGSKICDFDNVMKLFKENGIVCETLHAPYDKINDMWQDEPEQGNEMLNRLKDGVDKCVQYGIDTIVVHVSSGRPMPEITKRGIARFDELFNYAKSKGVTVALENLRYYENLSFLMDKYKDVTFCWDNGHENCYTADLDFVKIYGERLSAIHINDNRGIMDADDHLLPFDGNIDFEVVAKKLFDIGYEGTLMLEVTKNASIDGEMVYNAMTDEEYFERAVSAAGKLAEMVDSLNGKK